MKKNSVGVDEEWRARDDMRTLIEAKRIMKDRKRLAAARAMAQKQVKEMQESTALLAE